MAEDRRECPSCAAERDADPFGGFEEVARVGQAYLAELLALRLRDAGIECQILDQAFNQEPVPSVPSLALVRVLVPGTSVGEARRVLLEDHALPADVEGTEEWTEDADRPGPGPVWMRSEGTRE
jgi:hypothetical protein